MGTGLGDIDPVGVVNQRTRKNVSVWDPVLSVSETFLGMIMYAKMKISYSLEVIIVMQFITYLWGKQLVKESYLLINFLVGLSFWEFYNY